MSISQSRLHENEWPANNQAGRGAADDVRRHHEWLAKLLGKIGISTTRPGLLSAGDLALGRQIERSGTRDCYWVWREHWQIEADAEMAEVLDVKAP